MRCIKKNQITEFLSEGIIKAVIRQERTATDYTIPYIEESDEIDVIEKYNISIFIENQTKEECIALAEKLGLTLID